MMRIIQMQYKYYDSIQEKFSKLDAERGGEGKIFEPYLKYGENIFPETDKVMRRFWKFFIISSSPLHNYL
ncbi:MAG: hypothetical protein UR79_C0001G0049 [Candidatus Campbellbacteria bacterium GW2011_GWD1_35_49]|nr:MAG: hypothetical protein UR74_C0001G0280 [Candidatus Campbellbacteria bacterium GW2011_GWD2_35_24]KKP76015.1 MAG: hypothetical protein UR75_C0001G0049 [Candidatus Campbellbacteria bacterium GW2011_GWC2_35_28]KKP77204.1 MAG: hypothetical protein UR76_C0001G0049 [Candidatus Campbellbacteria bacterium GW2011_GWC1_35_31]KKP79133.1 MAG: hypothetical protein UR79_C0001G0049 [Candidatus Campbellbacteria bacterium GW2011_GWD1_35_49]